MNDVETKTVPPQQPSPSGNEQRRAGLIGQPLDRVDGRPKVTGAARYTAEVPVANLAHGVLAESRIARGRIRSIDTRAAERAPGVVGVLTHRNAPRRGANTAQASGVRRDNQAGENGRSPNVEGVLTNRPDQGLSRILQDDRITHAGQHIAVVIAETWEQATYAATLLRVEYEEEAPATNLEANRARRYKPTLGVVPVDEPADKQRGAAAAALPRAAVRVEQTYSNPIEHHHPMEMHATTALWEGEHLTLYDSNQGPVPVQRAVAAALALPAENVRVVTKFVGGGFGSKGRPWTHVILAALAARLVRRPVKLSLTRQQMFTSVGYRAKHIQQIALGAERDGKLLAIQHDSTSHVSMFDEYAEAAVTNTRKVYACPNVSTTTRIVRLNLPTPTSLRSPGKSTGMFALESAMDELAHELKLDPVELRLRNHADGDPDHDGRAWSSKSLKECYRVAAQNFGWSRRHPTPRSQRDGRFLTGQGMATAMYPAYRGEASARARITADGHVLVQSAANDMGVGTYTTMAIIAAETLNLPLERVRFELGDTEMPYAPVAGGSRTVASVGPAVQAACRAVQAELIALAINNANSPLYGLQPAQIAAADGRLFLAGEPRRGESYQDILRRTDSQQVSAEADARPGAERNNYSMYAFGAGFAEVRVDEDLGIVRVTRFVGAYGAGRIINEKTARSQLIGGIVWGIGHALMEESLVDDRAGRFVTRTLADYHIPAHADVPAIEIHFIPENDPYVNPLGAKGVGELSIVGAAAAIANAIFNATGKRVRDLPITPDKLL